MSRLIDADKLKKVLSEMEDEYKATLNENCNDDPFSDGVLSALFTIFSIINNQPTAFDVDKVIEQLDELKDKAQLRRDELSTLKVITSEFIDKKGYERGRVYAFDDAIEVVKDGGIDE